MVSGQAQRARQNIALAVLSGHEKSATKIRMKQAAFEREMKLANGRQHGRPIE
jgi:hypothetical protein